jgi:hypothetical protein
LSLNGQEHLVVWAITTLCLTNSVNPTPKEYGGCFIRPLLEVIGLLRELFVVQKMWRASMAVV